MLRIINVSSVWHKRDKKLNFMDNCILRYEQIEQTVKFGKHRRTKKPTTHMMTMKIITMGNDDDRFSQRMR